MRLLCLFVANPFPLCKAKAPWHTSESTPESARDAVNKVAGFILDPACLDCYITVACLVDGGCLMGHEPFQLQIPGNMSAALRQRKETALCVRLHEDVS